MRVEVETRRFEDEHGQRSVEVYAGPASMGLYLGRVVQVEGPDEDAPVWEVESAWPETVGGDIPRVHLENAITALVNNTLLAVGNFGLSR